MADELNILYSNGSEITQDFDGQPRKSIGGIITNVKVPNTFQNIFGKVSLKELSEGGEQFRLLYLRNVGTASPSQDIAGLKFFVDVPVLAPEDDPADLVPAPSTGDKHIVPPGGKGEWFVADEIDATINTVAGKQATFNGTGWDFSFAPFGAFEFGFVAPADIAINNKTTLIGSFVTPIENGFEPPAGVDFVSADTVTNETTIGTGVLLIGINLGMWIKRIVAPFEIQRFDLDVDEGGIVVDESIPIKFTYDTP